MTHLREAKGLRHLCRAASLLLFAGCHGAAGVSGVVVAPGDPATTMALAPIDGATIAIKCPDLHDGPGLHATTNGQGLFKVTIERRFSRRCTLEVQKPGFDSASIVLGDVCPRHEEEPAADYCGLEAIVVVQLHKTATPAQPTPS